MIRTVQIVRWSTYIMVGVFVLWCGVSALGRKPQLSDLLIALAACYAGPILLSVIYKRTKTLRTRALFLSAAVFLCIAPLLFSDRAERVMPTVLWTLCYTIPLSIAITKCISFDRFGKIALIGSLVGTYF